MLQYKKIDVSVGIDVNKKSASKECELCHYWYFKDVGFKYEEHVCNRCHDLSSAKRATSRCIFWGISRDEAVNRLNNSVLENKGV